MPLGLLLIIRHLSYSTMEPKTPCFPTVIFKGIIEGLLLLIAERMKSGLNIAPRCHDQFLSSHIQTDKYTAPLAPPQKKPRFAEPKVVYRWL